MVEPLVPSLPQTRLFKMGRVRRDRMLPVRGTVLAQNGSRVGSLDVVAKAESMGHLRPVPLGRYLRTNDANLAKYLVKHPGDSVEEHEIIASRPELFGTLRRTYRAPSTGRVTASQGAWLALDLTDKPFELAALYRGTIVNVMQRQGVVIEATGALAQGVWGAGGECYGVLKKMIDAPDHILAENQIDMSARGVILMAGGVTEGAIRRAAQEHAAGLVVGSLAPDLRGLVKTLAFPTVVTDGLGNCPMSAPFFELLSAFDKNEAILNTFQGTPNSMRPEVFIPILATGEVSPVLPMLTPEVDALVRVIGGTHLGVTGTIVSMSAQAGAGPFGITLWGAEIETKAKERLFVPWDNLELLG